jgi:hypothetical protein
MIVSIDQFDPTRVRCAELCCRYLVLVESATASNPRQPDWEGLEMVVAGTVTPLGQIETPGFNEWMSGVQRDSAQVMKQGRLLREERAAATKRKDPKGPKEGE